MISNTAELIVLAIGLSAFVFYRLKLNDDQSLKLSPWTTFFLCSSYHPNLKSKFLIASRVFKFFAWIKNKPILSEGQIKRCDRLSNFRSLLLWMNLCFNILQIREKADHNFAQKSITFQVTKDIKIPVKLNFCRSRQNGNFYPDSRFYTEISLA
ncbi:MAG: hypothetical protein WBA77_16300 [Microcoleaceae cyanobacterium]